MKRMLANNVTALMALTAGGLSLSATANASPLPHTARPRPHRHHHDRTVGQHNTATNSHSPSYTKGTQNSEPESAGGQNAIQNALCRKSPCRISQKVTFLPWDVSAYIALSPTDYLVIP